MVLMFCYICGLDISLSELERGLAGGRVCGCKQLQIDYIGLQPHPRDTPSFANAYFPPNSLQFAKDGKSCTTFNGSDTLTYRLIDEDV